MPKRLLFNDVKAYVESTGETLVSTGYTNNRTKLDFKCRNSHDYSMTLSDFKAGCRCRICTQAHNEYVDRGDFIEVKITNTFNNTSFIVDKESVPKIKKHTWRFDGRYICTSLKVSTGKFTTLQLHRLLLPNDSGELSVDHINRDRLDNRLINLRLATNIIQNRNKDKPITNRSGRIGVTFIDKGNPKYVATLNYIGNKRSKTFSIKKYGDLAFELACQQRDKWEKEFN